MTPRGPLALPPGGAHWYAFRRSATRSRRPSWTRIERRGLAGRLAGEHGLSYEQTILGGFSQGGVMTHALSLGGQAQAGGVDRSVGVRSDGRGLRARPDRDSPLRDRPRHARPGDLGRVLAASAGAARGARRLGALRGVPAAARDRPRVPHAASRVAGTSGSCCVMQCTPPFPRISESPEMPTISRSGKCSPMRRSASRSGRALATGTITQPFPT